MNAFTFSAPRQLYGRFTLPGDKSISHRAVIFNALTDGIAHISNFLPGADCLSTIACLRALGVDVQCEGTQVTVAGVGLHGLCEPSDILDCGNSGTTLRLLTGLLAGQAGRFAILTGDRSLRSRPQRRIVVPLRALGAQLDGRNDGDRAPLAVRGATIAGGHYELLVASAQVKSALLLAALAGTAPLTLTGKIASRDHTERMLQAMGVQLTISLERIELTPLRQSPAPLSLRVPGDPSSAAFWWVAAAIHPNAELTTLDVCLNPTRTGALEVLRAMGAEITLSNERLEGSEPVGDVTVRSSSLQATTIEGALIPRLIDEIPVLAVAAACATGTTIVRDAQELRAKETDRIATVATGLAALGTTIEATADGLVITGRPGSLHGTQLESYGDHRLAMAWAIAACVAKGTTTIKDPTCADVSYPGFWDTLKRISNQGNL